MEITLYNYNRVYFKQNPKLVYLYKFNTVSHFFQMYFHDHNCSKCKGRKTLFYKSTHSNDIQSFIAASGEIRIYNLTKIPIVKSPIS